MNAFFRFRFLALLAAFVFAGGAFSRADEIPTAPENLISPAHAIDPAHVPAPWNDILTQLQKKGNVESSFTESRTVPFKNTPVVFTGEVRISADHGMSLHYSTPEDRTMIIDEHGILLRNASGHSRQGPSDPRAAAATTALLDVMRFNFAGLAQHFDTYAAGDAKLWFFGFEPKDDEIGHALSRIIVTGSNDQVQRIVIRKSARSNIEITIGEAKTNVTFTPEELKRYFR
jgi:outer membrane lipoprotein-sorting protein